MGNIQVKPDYVRLTANELLSKGKLIADMEYGLARIKGNLEPSILSNNDLSTRLTNVCDLTDELEMQLRAIERFIKVAMNEYDHAERLIEEQIQQLSSKLHSLK